MVREATPEELQMIQQIEAADAAAFNAAADQGVPVQGHVSNVEPPVTAPTGIWENAANAFRNEASANVADYPVDPGNPGTFVGGALGGFVPPAAGALAGAGAGFLVGGPPGAAAGALYGGITGAAGAGAGRAVDRQMDQGVKLQQVNPLPVLAEGVGEGALQALAPGTGSIWRRMATDAAKQGIGTGVISAVVQQAESGSIDAQRMLMDAAAGAGGGAVGGIIPKGRAPASASAPSTEVLTSATDRLKAAGVQPSTPSAPQATDAFKTDLAAWQNIFRQDPQKGQVVRQAITDTYGIDPVQYIQQNYAKTQTSPTDTVGQWRTKAGNAPADLMNPETTQAVREAQSLQQRLQGMLDFAERATDQQKQMLFQQADAAVASARDMQQRLQGMLDFADTASRQQYDALMQEAKKAESLAGQLQQRLKDMTDFADRAIKQQIDATIPKQRQQEITEMFDAAAKEAAEASEKLQKSLEQGEFDLDAAKAWLNQKVDQIGSLARVVEDLELLKKEIPPTDFSELSPSTRSEGPTKNPVFMRQMKEDFDAAKAKESLRQARLDNQDKRAAEGAAANWMEKQQTQKEKRKARRKAEKGQMVTLESAIPNIADRAYRAAKAGQQFALSTVSDKFEGAWFLLKSLYMHTSNILPEELGDAVHAGASRKAYFISDHAAPVVDAAKAAGYDPSKDDKWVAELFRNEKLRDIAEGRVDYQAYMGDRYSAEMQNLAEQWAASRITAPTEAKVKVREKYDELRRAYFHDRLSNGTVGQIGQDGNFVFTRQLFERDLHPDMNSKDAVNVTSDYPLLGVFLRDMEMMANRVAFNPVKKITDKGYEFEEDSIARRLFELASDVTARKDQRQAAADTLKLLDGTYDFGKVLPKILANFSDGVLTQNLGSAMANYASVLAISKASVGSIKRSVLLLRSDPVAKALVKRAGLQDHISFLKDLVDDKNVRFEDASGDLYRMSEEHVRGITYLATILDELKTQKELTLADLLEGKKAGVHELLGRAVKEVQDTQGTAHNLSIRAGKVIAPGSFLLQNARVSEMGRTLAQARAALKTGNVKPLLRNILVRTSLGGGRMIVDPNLARVLIPVMAMIPGLSPDQKATISQQLNAIAANGNPAPVDMIPGLAQVAGFKGVLGVLDSALGSELSSKFSMMTADIPILSDVMKGTVKPVDLQYAAHYVDQALDPEAPASIHYNASQSLVKKLTPVLGSLKVSGVRMSPHLLTKIAEAGEGLAREARGEGAVFKDVVTDYHVPQLVMSPFISGNMERQRVISMEIDRQQLKDVIRQENAALYAGEAEGSVQLSDRAWKLLDHYVKQYGDIDPAIKAAANQEEEFIRSAMEYQPSRTERYLDMQQKEAIAREYEGDTVGASKLKQFVEQQASEYNAKRGPTRRGYDVESERQDIIKQGL